MELNLILNYGRVSSMGIVEALNAADCGPVLHVHKSNLQDISFELMRYLSSGTLVPQDLLWAVAANCIRDSNILINVVCPVREPLTRDISALTYGREDLVGYMNSPDFINDFFARNITFAMDWLLRHLVPFTGIDIFDRPFDCEKGYQIAQYKNLRLLMLQSELSNERKGSALQKFLGLTTAPKIHDSVNSSGYSAKDLESLGLILLGATSGLPIKVDRMLSGKFYTRDQLQTILTGLRIPLGALMLPDVI